VLHHLFLVNRPKRKAVQVKNLLPIRQEMLQVGVREGASATKEDKNLKRLRN
jgi:hypothetical protein